MISLKLDRTKLITVTNYAKKKGVERQTVYNWVKSKQVVSVDIDGVMFIYNT